MCIEYLVAEIDFRCSRVTALSGLEIRVPLTLPVF